MRWHLPEDIKCNEKRVVVRDKPRGKLWASTNSQRTRIYFPLHILAVSVCGVMIASESILLAILGISWISATVLDNLNVMSLSVPTAKCSSISTFSSNARH